MRKGKEIIPPKFGGVCILFSPGGDPRSGTKQSCRFVLATMLHHGGDRQQFFVFESTARPM